MSDYLFDKSGHDPDIAELEELLGGYRHRAPLREPPAPRRRRGLVVALALGAAAVIAAAVVLLVVRRGGAGARPCAVGGPGFAFAVKAGAARCGGDVAAAGTMPVGAWLETSGGAIADVRIADIGDLTVYGDSRLRLVGTGPGQHRLELARGKISARVLAPPRLFVIDTPVAAAVDLGCAYELVVDADGRTHLRVTSGVVSLEGKDGQAYVPMGHEVIAVPGRGPGTPVANDAAAPLRDAIARFDAGDRGALAAIIGAAGARDTVSLWNLLPRTHGADREAVFRALDTLVIRPEWVLEEDVLAGQPQALEAWRESLDADWLMR